MHRLHDPAAREISAENTQDKILGDQQDVPYLEHSTMLLHDQ